MRLHVLTWNLFHGRDFPPDPALRTCRSRLCRREERGATHVQVNRELREEFATVLAGADWDVALLQECPPRWAAPLAMACGAQAHRVLTSRNSFAPVRAAAARLNPDLIASNEGGSNVTLVRGSRHRTPRSGVSFPSIGRKTHTGSGVGGGAGGGGGAGVGGTGGILERREVAVHTGPLERRAMALTLVRGAAPGEGGAPRYAGPAPDLCVANLHASANDPALAAEDVRRAAEAASAWAAGRPLLLGGDLNLRPAESPAVFDELRERFGLAGATAPGAIDHLLVAGMETIEPPRAWPPHRRELPRDGLALRLSDHAPVQGEFSSYGSNTVMA